MTTSSQTGGGIRGALRDLGATALTLVSVRAELLVVEFHEEQERGRRELTLVFVASVFLTLGMLLAALLVIVLLWDSYRVAAAGGVAALYLGIGGWALVRLRRLSRDSPVPFVASMREFAEDLKQLRGGDAHHE